MPARSRAPARAPSSLRPLKLLAALLLLPLAGSLLMRGASAEAPPGVSRLDPGQARRAGLALELDPRPDLPVDMVEVRRLEGTAADVAAQVLLDVADQGEPAAVTDRVGLDPATLTLAFGNGSQLRIDLPGLLAAEFAPDGSWLAVVDGSGAMSRLSTADGSRIPLAPGPFLGPLSFEPSGTLLALAVSSVEAPFRSHLVRVDPESGEAMRIGGEELVYGAELLSEGEIAVVAHRPDGTLVLRVTGEEAAVLADLGEGAVNVTVSGDAGVIVWERGGETYVLTRSGTPRRLAAGARPVVSPDGSAILVDGPEGARQLIALDGTPLARLSEAAAFVDCGRCRP